MIPALLAGSKVDLIIHNQSIGMGLFRSPSIPSVSISPKSRFLDQPSAQGGVRSYIPTQDSDLYSLRVSSHLVKIIVYSRVGCGFGVGVPQLRRWIERS